MKKTILWHNTQWYDQNSSWAYYTYWETSEGWYTGWSTSLWCSYMDITMTGISLYSVRERYTCSCLSHSSHLPLEVCLSCTRCLGCMPGPLLSTVSRKACLSLFGCLGSDTLPPVSSSPRKSSFSSFFTLWSTTIPRLSRFPGSLVVLLQLLHSLKRNDSSLSRG